MDDVQWFKTSQYNLIVVAWRTTSMLKIWGNKQNDRLMSVYKIYGNQPKSTNSNPPIYEGKGNQKK